MYRKTFWSSAHCSDPPSNSPCRSLRAPGGRGSVRPARPRPLPAAGRRHRRPAGKADGHGPARLATSLPSCRARVAAPLNGSAATAPSALQQAGGQGQGGAPLVGARRGLARQRRPPARDSQPGGRLQTADWNPGRRAGGRRRGGPVSCRGKRSRRASNPSPRLGPRAPLPRPEDRPPPPARPGTCSRSPSPSLAPVTPAPALPAEAPLPVIPSSHSNGSRSPPPSAPLALDAPLPPARPPAPT